MIIVNPGSGPVRWATVQQAAASMAALKAEAGVRARIVRRPKRFDEEGRYAFLLQRKGRRPLPVYMPGMPPADMKSDALFTPRLYVDGNSWWWKFAVDIVRDHFA